MRLRELARATGLDETTISRLARKGVLASTTDTRGRVFSPSAVEFLRKHYHSAPIPEPSPIEQLLMSDTCECKKKTIGERIAAKYSEGKLWLFDKDKEDLAKLINNMIEIEAKEVIKKEPDGSDVGNPSLPENTAQSKT